MVDKSCVLTILSQEVWEKVRMEREGGRERGRGRGRGRMKMNFNFIQLGDAHKNLDERHGRLECCSYKVNHSVNISSY